MKKILCILFLLTGPLVSFSQHSNSITLKGLKKVNCKGLNEKSSKKKQLQCLGLDVIKDSTSYFPEFAQNYGTPVTSPEIAWEALQELYPNVEFTCWTEYHGYYVFSFDCGIAGNRDKCSFPCIIYIPIGGNEFWFYVPRF